MPSVPFKQVDVFTNVPYQGNPVAVVLDAEGLSDEQMQRIANWTNLSETTFVLPATQANADYRVRIFTPHSELPFAGHPTLGTAHALLEAGKIAPKDGALTQECAAGLIPLTVTESDAASPVIAFTLPQPKLVALTGEQIVELEAILGMPVRRDPAPKFIDVGPVWTIAQLDSAASVLALRPDFARMAAFDKRNAATGVVVFGPHDKGSLTAIEVRAFAPSIGVNEDPVCGSGNGSVAAFIRDAGQIQTFGNRFLSAQGAAVGRAGNIAVTFDGEDVIRIGGQSVTCVDGSIVV
ncbi:Trans-2,3-dihydro-3-hydroxyanthranilate isomerase [compost metagenome]